MALVELATGAALATAVNTTFQRQDFAIKALKQENQATSDVALMATGQATAAAGGSAADGRGSLVNLSV